MRLDKFLSDHFGISRNQTQKLINNKQVLVNKKIARTAYRLCENDRIEVLEKQTKKEIAQKKQAVKTQKFKLKIIFEDNDFLVIDKPAGIAVHPSEKGIETTLIDLVLNKYPQIAKIGENPLRPGIVHRLDKNVSGVMVIAKTQKAFDHLKEQFKKRQVKKEYTALVFGNIDKNEGTIDFEIFRSKNGKMAASPISQNLAKAKLAITDFEVLQRFKNYTLIKALPKTGRMHQIRVHFYAFNHPIVGDELYKQKSFKTKIKTKRIFLHATQLEFLDLNNEPVKFNSPLPLTMKNAIKNLPPELIKKLLK